MGLLSLGWLTTISLDLSLVARLAERSSQRTRHGKECFPGMAVTYALVQMVQQIAARSDKARIQVRVPDDPDANIQFLAAEVLNGNTGLYAAGEVLSCPQLCVWRLGV